jgi:hypothetical protein
VSAVFRFIGWDATSVAVPDPRIVALDEAMGLIEREIGRLSRDDRIVLRRIIATYGEEVAWHRFAEWGGGS